jgi:transposase
MACSDPSSDLNTFFKGLLGLDDPWKVVSVMRNEEQGEVALELEHPKGQKVECPDCGALCSKADHTHTRGWRHLDTMQYVTILRARVPRSNCTECGVKTTRVPWSDRFTRMTRMMEDHLVDILMSASSISAACELAGIDWSTAHRLMERAVERGLQRRESSTPLKLAGMDEKSFGRGHSYVTILNDLERACVIEVVRDRTREAAKEAWASVSEPARMEVEAVAMDMWPAYQGAAEAMVPNADVVFDRYHLSSHLNNAVDKVRREEGKVFRAEGDERLTSTRYLWLTNPENLSEKKADDLAKLCHQRMKTARAWAIKEAFVEFWFQLGPLSANAYFQEWYQWAIRSQLAPVKKVARMIKSHIGNLLTYFKHWITNAVSEGLNSRIQSLKSAARGFKRFENYRTRILFFCGGLDLKLIPVQP